MKKEIAKLYVANILLKIVKTIAGPIRPVINNYIYLSMERYIYSISMENVTAKTLIDNYHTYPAKRCACFAQC